MRSLASRSPIPAILLAILTLSLTGCPPTASPEEALMAAAAEAGVDVQEAEIYTVSRGDDRVVAAPIAGWESIDATELNQGVDVAFAHLASGEAGVAEGHYTLRAFAEVNATGTVPARVELVDGSGEVAGELTAEAEIHTLRVPQPAPFERTFVISRPGDDGRIVIWFRCPNGVCIRIPVLPPRPVAFPPIAIEREPQRALEQASGRANVSIDVEQTFSVFRPGSALAAAPITSWADLPARELPGGVDVAYAYLASDELDVPAGYYTLRAFAEPTGPGLIPGRVDVVDQAGEVVRRLDAEVEIHSMTIPEERPFPGTIITTIPGSEQFGIWLQCSNGQCVRLRL